MNHAKVAATALEACMALGRPPSSDWFNKDYEILRKFAELVVEHERKQCAEHYLGIMRKAIEEEREACARIADAELNPYPPEAPLSQYQSGIFTAAEHIAEAIRARNSNDQT